jgi:hypothetical protein
LNIKHPFKNECMNKINPKSNSIAPALALLIISPIIAEVLPGATRFSSLFVLPIEICVWGGGALLIRYAIRKWQLGWMNMIFLALALALAEECLIQQTSLAPMVLQIKGIVYARALGVNYVYLLWALVYEAMFVVIIPIYLVELIYPSRRAGLWLSKTGLMLIIIFFIIGSYLAWYSWTQIARPKVFHVPAYNPSLLAIVVSILVIFVIILIALGPFRNKLYKSNKSLRIPEVWKLIVIGFLCAVLWYGLVLLAFGIAPVIHPLLAISAASILVVLIVYLLPRWIIDPEWKSMHAYGIIFGAMLGSMLAGFAGFIGASKADLYFKILINILSIVFMIILGLRNKGTAVA